MSTDGQGPVARVRNAVERRRAAAGYWIERTPNLIHVSVLVFVPVLIAAVTWLSNLVEVIPFLLFPPLAAGTYVLFAEPSQATPRQFVTGLTAGAVCGWLAVEVSTRLSLGTTGPVAPEGAALSVFLVAAVTWVIGVDEPSAFSTALLVLVTRTDQLSYAVGVFASSLLVAAVFVVYRDRFYEHRAEYLYRTERGDDAVLVPLWDSPTKPLAHFAAQVAAAHDAGKVVLLSPVPEGTAVPDRAAPERASSDTETDARTQSVSAATTANAATAQEASDESAGAGAIDRVQTLAAELTAQYSVDCETAVVAGADDPDTALSVATDTGCDLVVAPFDPAAPGRLEKLFKGQIDVIGLQSKRGATSWRNGLVGVRSANGLGRATLDFVTRVSTVVSACHSIERPEDRAEAEQMLSRMVDAFDTSIETRVTNRPPAEFFPDATAEYDLLVLGASTDRSSVSRVIDPPTFHGIQTDCDLAVVHLHGP